MATFKLMRCTRRHAPGHKHQSCLQRVGPLVDYFFCGAEYPKKYFIWCFPLTHLWFSELYRTFSDVSFLNTTVHPVFLPRKTTLKTLPETLDYSGLYKSSLKLCFTAVILALSSGVSCSDTVCPMSHIKKSNIPFYFSLLVSNFAVLCSFR